MHFLLNFFMIIVSLIILFFLLLFLRGFVRFFLMVINVPKKKVKSFNVNLWFVSLGLCLVVVVMFAVPYFMPSKEELKVETASMIGFPVSHIVFETSAVSNYEQKKLIAALMPLMRQYRKSLDYYYSGYRGSGGHTVRVSIPSRYRFTGNRFEIITGSPIDSIRNPMLIPVLEAAAMEELPQQLLSDMHFENNENMKVTLDPSTAQLLSRHMVEDKRYRWKQDQCFLSVKGLVDPQGLMKRYPDSLESTEVLGQLTLRDKKVVKNTSYKVVAMDVVRNSSPSVTKQEDADPAGIYMVFSLVPEGVNTIKNDCEKTLIDAVDPKWLASALKHDMPVLTRLITATRVEYISRFSPGDMGEGWTEVADNR